MPELDYNDPAVEKSWCEQQRCAVSSYLRSQEIEHGRVGDWPAWHVAPCASIWAVESLTHPGWIGWWVIAGDLPTDYISAASVALPQHPRKAMRVFASNWLKMVEAWRQGRESENVRIAGLRSPEELAPLLETRARILLEWAADDSLWQDC